MGRTMAVGARFMRSATRIMRSRFFASSRASTSGCDPQFQPQPHSSAEQEEDAPLERERQGGREGGCVRLSMLRVRPREVRC